MKLIFAIILSILVFPVFQITPISTVQASETGFADMHSLRREKGKICMVSHFHSGSGKEFKSKRRAIKDAIVAWEDFTAWEYGSTWGRFKSAASRTQRCDKSTGLWQCSVRARPCKRRKRR